MRPFLANRLGLDVFMTPEMIEAFEIQGTIQAWMKAQHEQIAAMSDDEKQTYYELYIFFRELFPMFRAMAGYW